MADAELNRADHAARAGHDRVVPSTIVGVEVIELTHERALGFL
jgi:hypothetical protein